MIMVASRIRDVSLLWNERCVERNYRNKSVRIFGKV